MARWKIREHDPELVKTVACEYNVDPLIATCLINRGVIEDEEGKYFLEPAHYRPPDPYLMPDMAIAVARIEKAIEAGEQICVYGDYDADGVTAISLLQQGLRQLGGRVYYYIPDRFFEGVGLNNDRLSLLKENGVSLIITVDSGVRAFEEMAFARQLGLDVIVTDHHTPDDRRPDALAVLNPKLKDSKYPFKGLCGAGVAYKLIQALDSRFPNQLNMKRYIQIAAIGTIADMVPLRDENRWIVAHGLREISLDDVSPLRALLRRLGIRGEAGALDISFKVAPRINAPGRLGDPDVSIHFLEGGTLREVNAFIDVMDGMNTVRQMLEREVERKIENQLRHSIRDQAPPFIMVAGKHWHRGILGIMACKILRRFQRPVCVFSYDDHIAHGSMRGTPGVNLLTCLERVAPLLNSFGGHPEAAGLSLPITNLSMFKERMIECLSRQLPEEKGQAGFAIDAEIRWRDLNAKLFKSISRMAPFGIGNAAPVFFSANLILESELLRKGPWYHFEASDGYTSHKCSFYHPVDLSVQFERFDSIDLVYSITSFKDEYQVQIVEMRPSQG